MDEGRNVCLLFPESIEFGKDEEEFDRVKECFEVSCVFSPGFGWGWWANRDNGQVAYLL